MNIPMNYVAFDIETTGLNPKYDKIIEIGAVRVRNGEPADTFSTFINPAKGLPARIVELTGIHDADVADAPYIDEILDVFLAFVGDDVLLGHNILFDIPLSRRLRRISGGHLSGRGLIRFGLPSGFLAGLRADSSDFCATITRSSSTRTGL